MGKNTELRLGYRTFCTQHVSRVVERPLEGRIVGSTIWVEGRHAME